MPVSPRGENLEKDTIIATYRSVGFSPIEVVVLGRKADEREARCADDDRLGVERNGNGRRRHANLREGCRPYLLQELRHVSSFRRDWSDVAHHVCRRQAVGEGDSRESAVAPDAALARGFGSLELLQRAIPARQGNR